MGNKRDNKTDFNNSSSFNILTAISKLIDYSFTITDNPKKFPKKVRFSITNKIQAHVLTIYDIVLEANEIFPVVTEEDRARRCNLQLSALIECKKLLFMIELSKKRGYIGGKTFEYWTRLALNIKYMLAKWNKSEKESKAEAL